MTHSVLSILGQSTPERPRIYGPGDNDYGRYDEAMKRFEEAWQEALERAKSDPGFQEKLLGILRDSKLEAVC